jgi:hypothetical protein
LQITVFWQCSGSSSSLAQFFLLFKAVW